ncbi:hypothetical protein COU19_00175 [Candidatus Kaiserbacteria bacterium CG10_big_fil_rev_8_21_14_0_10_56_12]|uniref:Uncharacterized protein n=1 Tax=Candidatus Kaiserbacteria bacterium CG10_big_fil_rev_8_21_14_0_10_56_12 TaxID=1974611 RepID=A0A2H0UCK7_9BACT|nr:MAG: hypothetical protein COU19_00175 [Candidatus Kaiserbacteria bacterium CG10_big_fil_rev_8_21_14_0_10_56_12]
MASYPTANLNAALGLRIQRGGQLKRSQVSRYPQGAAEHVVTHARWQRSRGRNPSEPFLWEKNPRKALALAERMAYFSPLGEYLGGDVPDNYICSECGATDCKLWREYQTMRAELRCAPCAARSEGRDISDIDEAGMRLSEHGGRTDQIGWYIPAVPTEKVGSCWGYTAVPGPGCLWWEHLPTLPRQRRAV